MNQKFNSVAELMECLERAIGGEEELPKHTLVCDEFVMTPATAASIHDLKVFLRDSTIEERGERKHSKKNSLTVLFEGKSLQAKKLTARVLANQSGFEVVQHNLAKMVSKYAGEAEKQLIAILKEAETQNIVLFFDEADALFGKRTDVKDAHDRYANIELLEAIDKAEGVKIFSAVSKSDLNEAFLKRLKMVIAFPVIS